MPDLSGNATALRASGYNAQLYAAIFAGTQVYAATVTAIDDVHTTSVLTIGSGTGTIGDVKRGMQVNIYNSTGEFKGTTRVRRAGTISASSIPINETARGTIEIVANDTITIVDDHRLRPVFPEASATFAPDKETYTSQTEQFPPVAHSGGHYAAFVDAGQVYATVNFYGSSSYVLDSGSGGTVTHAWTFPAGSTPTSSTTADPVGVQIPQGEWVIEHTVTDSSNSKTWTQYVYCGIFDANNLPYSVDMDNLQLSGAEESGWELTFSLLESAGIDTLPDGAWVVLFARETYNGTVQSFGNRNSGRSSIKFVGILQNDDSSNTGNTGRQDLTFTAVSPIQALREMAGFSQYFDSKVTANSWQELENMSTKIVLIHLLRTYTTAADMLDIYYEADDYTYPSLSFQKATPYEAMKEIWEGIDSRFVSDRTCNLMFQTYPEYYEIADRSGLTTTFTLSTTDIIDLQIERQHHRPTRLLEGRAFYTSPIAIGALYARWPSLTPGEGSGDSVINWMIVSSQDNLNIRTGLHGGKLDRVFIDTDGYQQAAPRITVTLRNDVWDFYQEWIAFSLDATSNWREVDLSSLRWVIRQISVSYEQGAANVQLTLEAETAAPKAQTYIPPEVDDFQLPDIDIPPIGFIPPADPGPFPIITFGQGTGDAAAILENGKISVTSNFSDSPASWTTYDHSATLGTDVRSYSTDSSTAFFTTGTGAVGAWVATGTAIFYIDDIFSATPTITNQHTFVGTTSGVTIDADFIFNPGTHAIATYSIANDKFVGVYTTDGVNWTEADINATSPLTLTGGIPWVFYSTTTAGTAYCRAPYDIGGTPGVADDYALHVTTNSGASWAPVDATFLTLNSIGDRTLYFPFRGGGNQFAWHASTTDFKISDTVAKTTTLFDLEDNSGIWTVSLGKFIMQCAYSKNVAYVATEQGGQGLIWKTNSPGGYPPSFSPVSGTLGLDLDGLDCSPDGSEIVAWEGSRVRYWTTDNPTLEDKGLAGGNIIYTFVK